MRLLRVQIKMWRVMVAVAVVAILIAVPVNLERRAARFRGLAASHKKHTEGISGTFYGNELDRLIPEDALTGRRLSGLEAARFLWHSRIGWKYAKAASRPWFPVAPDPPEPSGDASGDLVALGEGVYFAARREAVEMILDYANERVRDHPELRAVVENRRYRESRCGWYFDDPPPDNIRLLGRMVDEMAAGLPAVSAREAWSEDRKAMIFADVELFRKSLAETIPLLK